ncbi:MAG: sugar ABC transporter permease [Actinobacteria bacterium]|nr:sugar ABC transporter permease [Actinomycetota bacterium]
MVASFILSLTDYSIIEQTSYVGRDNYSELIHDPKVRKALANTLIFTVMLVPATMIVALGLAMILLRVGRAGGFFRTVFYLPQMTPPVAVAILFLLFFNGSFGVINRGLELLGLPGPFWTTDPSWVKPGLVIMSVWSVGGTMVIYLAALKSVPQQLYEAAAMDGASSWRRFRDVTLPMISSALFFTFIILTISGLQAFTEAYTAFFGLGSESYSSEAALFYVIYLFRQAFEFFRMGYASALAWLLFVVIMVVTLIQTKLSKRFVFYYGDKK